MRQLPPTNPTPPPSFPCPPPPAAGKYTVPVLWDKKTGRIVNNESSEILRMLNAEFNELATNPALDL